VALGARREGRIKKLADETGAHARVLDVTDRDSVASFAGWTKSLDGNEKAEAPYRGVRPLSAEDVAECVRWAVTLPLHVNVDRTDVKPVRQAKALLVHRDTDGA
jgi:NADP-dependent 3-hydroxy acid dehydrogenase YdfG